MRAAGGGAGPVAGTGNGVSPGDAGGVAELSVPPIFGSGPREAVFGSAGGGEGDILGAAPGVPLATKKNAPSLPTRS